MHHRNFLVALLTLLAALFLGGCSGPTAPTHISAQGASVRVNPNVDAPWAAYFTLKGGSETLTITGVTVDGAGHAELHESRMEGGVAQMAALARISIPAGEDVIFRPGGKHVMLFDVTPAARTAGQMTLTLSFDDGSTLPILLAFAPQTATAETAAPAAAAVVPPVTTPIPVSPPTSPPTPAATPPTASAPNAVPNRAHVERVAPSGGPLKMQIDRDGTAHEVDGAHENHQH